MLWLKAFHIIFVVTWFAGLFYLPRLFVYHVGSQDKAAHERFVIMERRLLGITHIGGVLAMIFGIGLLGWWFGNARAVVSSDWLLHGWLHLKLVLVALLVVHHLSLIGLTAQFRDGRNRHSERWFRIYNEVPSVLLVAIVLLVVVKPF